MKRPYKVPKKLCQTKLHGSLGIISPSLFAKYLFEGDPEVVEFAEETGYFRRAEYLGLNELLEDLDELEEEEEEEEEEKEGR